VIDQIAATLRSMFTGPNGLALALLWGTVLLAAVVTYFRSSKDLRQHLLPSQIFKHPSARADFWFWIARRVTKPLYVWAALSAVGTGTLMHAALVHVFPAQEHAPGPAGPLTLLVFTFTMFLAYDLSYYIYHYLQHKVPLMWELHKVHHSAEVMVGVTQGRVHPLDDFMTHLWDGLLPGLVYGIWLFFALDPVEVTVFGINVYVLRNILMMDFVRHTHFKLSFGKWLNMIVLPPHWHQLHHSTDPRHWDKNFGLMLSVWDWLFGTLVIPEPNEDFHFGLANGEHVEYRSVTRLYLVPLSKICNILFPIIRPKATPSDAHPSNT